MSLSARKQLVQLARERNMLIVCDDVYDMLRWKNENQSSAQESFEYTPSHIADSGLKEDALQGSLIPPRLVDIERELMTEDELQSGYGHTCSNGSFSKLVAPGLKVGWVEGTENFVRDLSNV